MAGGLLAFMAAGAAEGVGTSMVERAKAKREIMMEKIRSGWLRERETDSREFQREERLASQDFQMELAEGKAEGGMDRFGFPTSSAISQKIRAFELQGFDSDTALALASGRKSISVNPQTGERVIVDLATDEIVPLKQPDYGNANEDNPASGETAQNTTGGSGLYDMADEATGVGSTVATGLSNTVGQVPGNIGDMATFPDQVQAGQEFELFKRDLVRSLSLNPRFPVAEQQRIENLVPRGALTAPDTLKQSLRSLDRELARIEREAQAGTDDPRAPIEQRQADTATLRSVRAARARLGVPNNAEERKTMEPTPEADSDGWTVLPDGTRIREKPNADF